MTLGAQVLFDAPDMAALYDDAELVLGSGGVSLFERMSRGRASVTLVAAKNQATPRPCRWPKLGATLFAGDVKAVDAGARSTKSIDALIYERR